MKLHLADIWTKSDRTTRYATNFLTTVMRLTGSGLPGCRNIIGDLSYIIPHTIFIIVE